MTIMPDTFEQACQAIVNYRQGRVDDHGEYLDGILEDVLRQATMRSVELAEIFDRYLGEPEKPANEVLQELLDLRRDLMADRPLTPTTLETRTLNAIYDVILLLKNKFDLHGMEAQ